MSEHPCDICGKIGQRPAWSAGPEGWLYGESEVDGEVFITLACSRACAEQFWRPATPGSLLTGKQDEGGLEVLANLAKSQS